MPLQQDRFVIFRHTRAAQHDQPVSTADRIPLDAGATVAVIGGGPAGAFFAIHLLRQAAALGRQLRLVIFERRHHPANPARRAIRLLVGLQPLRRRHFTPAQ